jgi:large subunit ribosomal protein L4
MGLSQKAHEKKIIALDALTIPAIKTKTLATLLRKLPLRGRSTLLLQPKRDPLIAKSARNIPKVQTIAANSVNIVDILRHEYLLVPQESFAVLQKTFQQNATP